MGMYHPDPAALVATGRRIYAYGSGFAAAKRELRADEELYLWLDRTTRQIAPLISDQAEWDAFYQQYAQGWWLEYRTYAAPKEAVWT